MHSRRSILTLIPAALMLALACESYPEVIREDDEPLEEGGSPGTGGSGSGDSPSTGGREVLDTGGTSPGTGGTVVDAVCGNGELELGELCDDANTVADDGCSADCLEQGEEYICSPGERCVDVVVCGSGKLEGREVCDDGNDVGGDGCAADCYSVEEGWLCPRPDVACVRAPVCGNSQRERGEQCDDGNAVTGDGCSGTENPDVSPCQLDAGYWCPVAGETCVAIVCGDGLRSPTEECDDGDIDDSDGCSSSCVVEDGWICPEPDRPCLSICGDGLRLGGEECDDANQTNGDGCNAACRNEPGYSCETPGEPCAPAVCGNSGLEFGEGCDDGNLVAGDGCGPTCQLEPTVTVGPEPLVAVTCGDGLQTSNEGCDDGNQADGDGCSSVCTVDDGYACDPRLELPESVTFQVTYRDFMRQSDAGGHPHMRDLWTARVPRGGDDRGIPGEICNTTNGATCGRLDAEGKPQLAAGVDADSLADLHDTLYVIPEAFGLWYRSENTAGVLGYVVQPTNPAPEDPPPPDPTPIEIQAFPDVLTLTQEGGAESDTYVFDSTSFFPLDDRGFGLTPGQTHNFHFTTELRYFFQYQGGETLTFRGDDDVFVYVNGRLAVDIGGIHNVEAARVVLGDDGEPAGTDSDCSAATLEGESTTLPDCALSSEEADDDSDDRFGLVKGGVYEIVLFHAERQPIASNFRLTLAGFLAPRSSCAPVCQDGLTTGWEVCDDGPIDPTLVGTYDHCNITCTGRTFCGDAIRQGPNDDPVGPEECDNGTNNDPYTFSGTSCAAGCVLPPYCGDGTVQADFELCDNGDENDDTTYDGCKTNCEWGPYCGDGTVQSPEEECDDGTDNVLYSADGQGCGPDCVPAPYCGDGIRNGPEECDYGTENNTGEYGGCSEDCTLAPYCGDGLIQADEGEECDDGPVGSLNCSPDCRIRGIPR
ncbi:MAG: DUF4215 domain-containing protein [Polyangiaceae bacterium]|nr:DUF4215 domain-containing protein [Polyangiaceae bacterium]